MTNRYRYQPPSETGGGGGGDPRDSRAGQQRFSSGEHADPFFKDPAVHVGEDVARSLSRKPTDSDSGSREVIRDAFTAEVPYEAESTGYDGASYGAQMENMVRESKRDSGQRPRGVDGKDLEAIYAKKWRSDDTLTMREGLPKKEFSVWNVPGVRLLVKLAIIGAIVGGVFMVRLAIVDEDGNDTTSPLPVWIYRQMTMGSEQQMMQRLEPFERQFALTLMRIKRVASAAVQYELTFGRPPGAVEDLLAENMVLPSRVADGWGNYFRVEMLGETVLVRSAGKDLSFNTGDDITTVGDSQPVYSISHYSREAEQLGADSRF